MLFTSIYVLLEVSDTECYSKWLLITHTHSLSVLPPPVRILNDGEEVEDPTTTTSVPLSEDPTTTTPLPLSVEYSTTTTGSCPQMELLRGRDGRDGRDGPRGEKGDFGQQGDKGDMGLKGDKGSVGERGGQGASGPQGLAGPCGPEGVKGERGGKGDRGSHGFTGIQGPPGPAGVSGVKGERGESGERGEKGEYGPPYSGGVYIRWGRASCPNTTGTELVYSGRAGGDAGTGSLCLPTDPASVYNGAATSYRVVQAMEYYSPPTIGLQHCNVPCAMCYTSPRHTVTVIPAKTTCPHHWTLEYAGYIMAVHSGYHKYDCIDWNAEAIPGTCASESGFRIIHTRVVCDHGVPCPPYRSTNVLMCAVCSR